jgi:beta-lactamase regulating signal transducer with metallopeptidase domain
MIASALSNLESYVCTVTTVLAHSLWEGIIVAIFAFVALSLLKNSAPRIRYAMCCCAMVVVLMATAATAVAVWPDGTGSAAYLSGATDGPAREEGGSGVEPATSTPAPSNDVSSPDRWWKSPSIAPYSFMIWVAGVILLSVYHLLGWSRARRLATLGSSAVSTEWQARFEKLCLNLGVRRLVSFMSSSVVKVPCVVGCFKPVILVPVSMFTSLSPSEIEMILVHELAHVRRYDVFVNIMQTAMETLFFFNPAIWWLSRQIRIEREDCCDDAVILTTGNRLSYARALASLEELRMSQTSFGFAYSGTALGHRIRRIVGVTRPRLYSSVLSFSGAVLVASLIAAVVLGALAGLDHPAARAGGAVETAGESNPKSGDLRGDWETESDGNEVRILVYGKGSSGMNYTLDRQRVAHLVGRGTSSFQIVRDAGTLFLEGALEENGSNVEGDGKWYFRPDSSYVRYMAKYGLGESDKQKAFSLAIRDISREYLREMEARGYSGLNVDQLISAGVFGISPELVDEYSAAGYPDLSYNRLLSMQVQGVRPEDSRRFEELGFGHLTADQLISARIHGVTLEFVERFRRAGFQNLSFKDFVGLRVFGLDVSGFEDCYRHRFMDSSESMMVWVCGLGITLEDIEEMKELGFEDVDEIVRMLSNDVTSSYIRGMSRLGYDGLAPSMIIELHNHNVTPSLVKRLRMQGVKDLTPEALIDHARD